jgi:signal peptidase II
MNFLIRSKEFKSHLLKRENIYLVAIIIATFFIDRFSKIVVINNYTDGVHRVNDFINFDLIWNIGIGFGFFSTDSTIFYNLISIIIGLVIIALFLVLLTAYRYEKFIYSIIIGGALGNFYDRLVYNAVPDFIDLHYANFHWFTFNLADIFISIGIIIFVIRSYLVKT